MNSQPLEKSNPFRAQCLQNWGRLAYGFKGKLKGITVLARIFLKPASTGLPLVALKRLAGNCCFALRLGGRLARLVVELVAASPASPASLGLGLPIGFDLVAVQSCWFRVSVGLAEVLMRVVWGFQARQTADIRDAGRCVSFLQ